MPIRPESEALSISNHSPLQPSLPAFFHTVTELKPTIATLLSDQGPIASGNKTQDTIPTLIGSGLPAHLTVALYNHDKLIGHTETNAEGRWKYRLEAPLGLGEHSFTVRLIDRDGSQSQSSDPYLITVEPRTPIQPTIDGVYDNTGEQTGLLNKDDVTDETRPTLLGSKLPAGLLLTIFDNGQVLGYERTSSTGQWCFRPMNSLHSGKHSFTVQLNYPDGSVSHPSEPFTLQIEPQATLKPVIDSALDDVGQEQGGIPHGGMTDDRQPTLIGGGLQSQQLVTIYLNNEVLGHVRTDDQGRWSFEPRTPLEFGEHQFKIRVSYPNGSLGPFSDNFTLTVTPLASLKPSIDGVYDSMGAQQGLLASGDVTDDPRPALFGSGLLANQWVNIYDNGLLIGSTQANARGQWSFKPSTELGNGSHLLTIRVARVDGSLSPSSEPFELMIESTASSRPVIDTVVDDVGSEQGAIANGGVTDDSRPTIFGKSPFPNQLITLFDNNHPFAQVRSDADGHWRYDPTEPLAPGQHSITVRAINPNGQPSEPSEPFLITVIAPSSNRPSIQGVYDDFGNETGLISNGGHTDDARAIISGAGLEPYLLVTIFDNGQEIGKTHANALGQWSFKPSGLSQGEHRFTVQTSHPDGSKSELSEPYVIHLTPHNQSVLQIEGVHDQVGLERGLVSHGGKTDDMYAILSGSGAQPFQEVVIYTFGQSEPVGRVRSNALGKWLFEPKGPWKEAMNTLTVRAVLPDGSEGPHSSPYVFNFQAVSPRPVIDGLYDDVGISQGLITHGGYTDDTRPSLFGKVDTQTARSVSIFLDGRNIAAITPDALGNWLYTPGHILAQGHHQFTVAINYNTGHQSAQSDPFAFNIERATSDTPTSIVTSPSMKPVIDAVFDTEGNTRGPIAPGSSTDDARPVLSGSGLHPLMGHVVIFDNGRQIGTANIDVRGNWTFKPSANLSIGSHELVIQVNYRNGTKSLQSESISFTVESAKPLIQGVYDDVGPNQGMVASGGITDDNRPTLTGGGALAHQTLRVYDDKLWIGEVRADALGNWLFEMPAALSLGKHTFTLQPIMPNGSWGLKSDAYELSIVAQSRGKSLSYQLTENHSDLILMSDAPLAQGDNHQLPLSPAISLTLTQVLIAPVDDALFAEPPPAQGDALPELTLAQIGSWHSVDTPSSEGVAGDVSFSPAIELVQLDTYAA